MEDDTSENQAVRWQRHQVAFAAPRVAIPVYTPRDYPLIRQLPGADDMPQNQVRAYLDMTGAERGLIVLMTRGTVIAVAPSSRAVAA